MDTVNWIIAVVVLGAIGIMVYSLLLQRKGTERQLTGLQHVNESIANQRAALELGKETNALLKDILKALQE